MKTSYLLTVLMGLWVFGAKCEIEQAQPANSQDKEVIQTVKQQGFLYNLVHLYPLAQKIQNFIKTHGYSMITLSCTLIGLYMNYYYSREQLACSRASLAQPKKSMVDA